MVVAVLTLALGIGAVTTIFTLINGFILKPLPFEESEQLMIMWEKLASFENASVSYPNFIDWRAQNTVFEDLAAINETGLNLIGVGDPVELQVSRFSASMLPLLREEPKLGRNFLEEEDKIGGEKVVILSYGCWQERFGGDPEIIGRVISLDNEPWTIIGVMAQEFAFPPDSSQIDLFVPIEQFATSWVNLRGSHPGINVIGRLKPGVTLEHARADMERVALLLEEQYPDNNTGSRVHLYPLHERITRDMRDPLLLLLAAVVLVLVIACANVANLMLARAISRQHEMAVRSTLGAGGRHLVRLLLAESVALWMIGGVGGLFLAYGATQILTSVLAGDIPRVFSIGIDFRVIIVALLISLVTGVLFGLVPGIKSWRPNLQEVLSESGRMTAGRKRHLLRNGLVIAEVTLAVVLLVGAGLTVRSFSLLGRGDPGLDPENVLTMEIALPLAKYSETEEQSAFFTRLLERVRALPGVVSAATTYIIPMGPDNWQNGYHVEGQPPEEPGQATFAETTNVSPDYFHTMGIPLLRGRDFADQDVADAQLVAIVDEHFAQKYWPDDDPIGKRFKFGDFESGNPWMEIVGVVGHVKLYGVAREVLEEIYIPYEQDREEDMFLAVKTEGDPTLFVESIRQEVLALDPIQPISEIATVNEYLEESRSGEGFMAVLLGIFAVAALMLASVGIYGVMSYATNERHHEIGIRMALGARSNHVLRMIIRQGMVMVGTGVVAGLVLAAVLGRFLASALYGVKPLDPPTFIIAPLFLAAVAILANLIPAWRATSVDPVETLRRE